MASWQIHLAYFVVSLVVIAGSLALGGKFLYASVFVAAAVNLTIARGGSDRTFTKSWILPIAYAVGVFLAVSIPLYFVLSKI